MMSVPLVALYDRLPGVMAVLSLSTITGDFETLTIISPGAVSSDFEGEFRACLLCNGDETVVEFTAMYPPGDVWAGIIERYIETALVEL